MKMPGLFSAVLLMLITGAFNAASQKVGFINSNEIREKFPYTEQAQQRVQGMTDKWKQELDSMQQIIVNLELVIEKNRLIWSETEYQKKEAELTTLKNAREDYAKSIFSPNGKYDQAVKAIFASIEEKIQKYHKSITPFIEDDE